MIYSNVVILRNYKFINNEMVEVVQREYGLVCGDECAHFAVFQLRINTDKGHFEFEMTFVRIERCEK